VLLTQAQIYIMLDQIILEYTYE